MIPVVTIDDSSNGRAIDVAAGDDFEIALEEKATAGFRWTLLSGGEPACVLTGDGLESAQHPPGAAAIHRWRFRAGAAGTVTIRFTYGRRWESAAVATFEVHVRVRQ
jgi:predicted secreted protein